MDRIQVLPESVKNKIAAGEVVEGPFSVIKELMENSIDAEAKEIDVEVIESGLKKISVRDNGKGIHRDDLPLSIQNHATSKIRDVSDIERISSYGFRGEALASISSISRLSILSRSIGEETGAKLISESGHTEITDFAGSTGTTIIIENLFYTTPARKKFLSSRSVEQRKIREIFLKTAIAKPEISFSLTVDGKRVLTLPSVSRIEERIGQVYGRPALENLSHESLKDIKAGISGFLSKPDYLKSSRSMQILYVNDRPVEYKYLGFFLSRAYEAVAKKGDYPAAIIFLKIDPSLIDVNIHPAKKEIKFFDQNYINNLIMNLSGKALGKIHPLDPGRVGSWKSGGTASFSRSVPPVEQKELSFSTGDDASAGVPDAEKRGMDLSYENKSENLKSFIRDSEKLYSVIKGQYNYKYLGTIFDTYIVIENDDALCLIDFHAAHERFIYDELIRRSGNMEIQNLIFPLVMELSLEDYQIFLEKKDYFNDTSFDIDSFSDNSIVVRGIPGILKDMDTEGFIADVLESLKQDEDRMEDRKKVIAEKAACHSAKRAGDSLTAEDAKMIADMALSGDHEKRCPHGRPYIFKLEKNDLEKVFKRS